MFLNVYSEALGPILSKSFDMAIWDPQSEEEVNERFDAQLEW